MGFICIERESWNKCKKILNDVEKGKKNGPHAGKIVQSLLLKRSKKQNLEGLLCPRLRKYNCKVVKYNIT